MESNTPQNREKKPLIMSIKESEVKVAPDGKAVVNIAIINRSEENDQVELTVKGLPEDWVSIDTPMTYIAAGAIEQAVITIQPPSYPQSDLGEYSMEVKVVSKIDPWRSDSVKCPVTVVAYESEGLIGVLLGSLRFSIMPNTTITIPMILKNRGVKEDVFILTFEGIPSDWTTTTSPLTKVNPGQSKQIDFHIQVPRSSQAHVGRNPFKIVVTSQSYSVEKVEVDCILTVAAFSQFSASLQPENLEMNQPSRLIVTNEGNTADLFNVAFTSPNDDLLFEKISQVQKKPPTQKKPQPELETVYTEIIQGESVRVLPGESGVLDFRSRPRSREIIGGDRIYAFSTRIQSASQNMSNLRGQVSAKAVLPVWLVAVAAISILVVCFLIFIPGRGANQAASATQTASALLTQTVMAGQLDSDADGLTDEYEISVGLDPFNPDTDADGLLDGQENETCPYFLNPDTDADTLIDGGDLDPCDPNNPSLTAAAPTATLQPTVALPTNTPEVLPTETPQATIPAPPSLSGFIVFQSNRDGNPDIYLQNAADGSVVRLTDNPGADTHPAWSPDGSLIAFTTNRDGNNEIYLMNSDGSSQINLTNSPGDDQYATWSSDGQSLAFASNRDGNWEIYVLTLDGLAVVNITNNPADDQHPSWFKTGGLLSREERIAFTTNRDGNQEIYTMGTDGTDVVNLTNNPADDIYPAASNDGDSIAFVSNRDGNRDIFLMDSDGGSPFNLTNDPDENLNPGWSPDDDWIAYSANQDIYVIKSDASERVNISNNPAGNDYPSWRE